MDKNKTGFPQKFRNYPQSYQPPLTPLEQEKTRNKTQDIGQKEKNVWRNQSVLDLTPKIPNLNQAFYQLFNHPTTTITN